jgi:hypothetical protein
VHVELTPEAPAHVVTVTGIEPELGCPAASVWTAISVCGASAIAVLVQANALDAQGAVQRVVAPSLTTTVAPLSQLPEIGGVALLVAEPSTGDVIAGGAGGVRSTVKFLGLDAGLT